MSEKLSELKDQLTSLGISTNTPGLKGKERLEELRNRLEDALCGSDANNMQTRAATAGGSGDTKSLLSIVDGLTSAQIRENLNLLGQNTNTPGLNGEERRAELQRRLIAAIEKADMAESFVEELKINLGPTPHTTATSHFTGTHANAEPSAKKGIAENSAELESKKRPENDEIKRLVEQRERMIRMRTEAGPHQESKLKELDNSRLQILAEIDFLKSNGSKDKFRKESSVFISDGELMPIGKLLSALALKKIEIQDQIEARYQQIIEAESMHPVYGVAVEKNLRDLLALQLRNEEKKASKPDMSSEADTVSPLSASKKRVADIIANSKHRVPNDKIAVKVDALEEKKYPGRELNKEDLDVGSRLRGEPKMEDSDQIDDKLRVLEAAPLVHSNRQEMTESSSSDDDCELPPLLFKSESPPPPIRSDESKAVDRHHEMYVSAESLSSPLQQYPPPSVQSELPTDTSFSTAYSPTANLLFGTAVNKNMKGKGDIDLKRMYRTSAAVAGISPPYHEDDQNDDIYGEDEVGADGDEGHTGNADIANEDMQTIKELRMSAKSMEASGHMDDAEAAYLKALDVDPTDIRTLDQYAIFLHRRRGELPRAAAFFRRAIQECIPGLLKPSHEDRVNEISLKHHDSSIVPHHSSNAIRSKVVTQVLLHYGRFLHRAQGDMDLAEDLFRKAVEISPDDGSAQASLGRFLASDPIDPRGPPLDPNSFEMLRLQEADRCFAHSLRLEPDNVTYLLWYAKLLKNLRKYPEADVLYSAALKKSKGKFSKFEPTAICNYASFLAKYKRDYARAEQLFSDGLLRYPRHKGLLKNHKHFSKIAAKKRPAPKVPQNIESLLLLQEEHLSPLKAVSSELPLEDSRRDKGEEDGFVEYIGGNDQNVGCKKETDDNLDEHDDGSVVSRITCDLEPQSSKARFTTEKSLAAKVTSDGISIEFDGVLSVPRMSCGGIVEAAEGSSKLVPLDVSDSNICMTVAVKPGSWKWIKDLNYSPDKKLFSVASTDTEEQNPESFTTVNLRSSMIVSVHQKSKSNPTAVSMLGFVVLTMTAILASPEVAQNVYLIERKFSSEKFVADPVDNSEKKYKISGTLNIYIKIGIEQ